MADIKYFEVIIIGGSYAGLSAAMALGRSLRKVLIIDSGLPCNRQTPYSHNFITHDGEKPSEISEKAKAEVLKYQTVSFLKDIAIGAEKVDEGFKIITQSGIEFYAKKIIFATGIKDTMLDIKGFAECWGISVIHCPYCHGYEFRGKVTGILANGARAFHLASMVNNLTDQVTLLTNGKPDFKDEQILKLKQHGIQIIETAITAIEHQDGIIQQVIFADGTSRRFEALYAALPFTQHSNLPVSLGCELTEHGYIKVGPFQETNIDGIYACGDNTNMMRSVALAVSTGGIAGAVINGKLVEENF
ncbi:thioredoxin reductase [Pedobacter psychrotolerans]|uniref:Thioredoxin reductase n=1 Tax=Pedobacter psychrotolerans TaxID=1843235 RepID=A0A4R2HD56_9SPHI|nr:NAD(P)/FAD-dependent oxidoreductase [Pedobacter psychrotolerans]TCO25372.1 thioredoxin reductase [Pedobacter psychrotolerans]GGE45960.1 thioredoxin reductase [Pedobacter psychrotolerans]